MTVRWCWKKRRRPEPPSDECERCIAQRKCAGAANRAMGRVAQGSGVDPFESEFTFVLQVGPPPMLRLFETEIAS